MVEVRRAEPSDDEAVARLLYSSAEGRYELFAGDRDRALALLGLTIARPGNDTSRDDVLVAEVGGEVAGALASYPAPEGRARRRRFVRQALRRRAPWRWPRLLRIARAGERSTPAAPAGALYIDAVATDPRFRRRGVATALVAAAEGRARSLGLTALALDTAECNAPARALYERLGFRVETQTPARREIPAIVGYVREVT